MNKKQSKVVQAALDQERRQREAKWFVDVQPVEYFFTGIEEFDAVTGFPKEMISLIYGPPGVGKSTLMYNLIKSFSGQGSILYIDTEAALSIDRLEALGINHGNLAIKRDQLIEDVYDSVMDGLPEYDLIIIDSLNGATFRAEIEGEASDANMGAKAKIINKMCRVLPLLLARNNCTVILVNHEQQSFNSMYGTTIPGGKQQLYSSSLTIRLSNGAKGKFQKNLKPAGHWVTAEIKKSRVCSPFQKIDFKVYY